jgi:hypothetical protein
MIHSQNGTYGVSPYFQIFDLSKTGVQSSDYPNLYKELKSFRFTVTLSQVQGLEQDENIRHIQVNIMWTPGYDPNATSDLVLHGILSLYES